MELSDSRKMKAADAEAIRERNIPSLVLMERAAEHLAEAALGYAGTGGRVLFICGVGNNGGDGLAAARLLKQKNGSAAVVIIGDPEKMTPDAREMEARLEPAGICPEINPGAARLTELLTQADAVVDALFGIGLSRPLAGAALEAVRLINEAKKPVIAADIPSGVSADSGVVPGEAVKAVCTVTFSAAKPGHFIEPGCVYCGRLVTADIGIPKDILSASGCNVFTVDGHELSLPAREPLTHKGDYGKVLVLGGSVSLTGAPVMASMAAVRGGAGLVYLGVPESIYPIAAAKSLEAMPFPIPGGSGGLSDRARSVVMKYLSLCDVCVIGPGMGRSDRTRAMTRLVLQSAPGPVIADADALWAISEDVSVLERDGKAPVVLTPHEGEFARLLGHSVTDRRREAAEFAAAHRCVVVLKGHRTLCAFPDGRVYIALCGNPGMATGGSGDVLAGLMGAMLGQLPSRRAVVTSCWLHGRAGDMAAERLGEYAMAAGDILAELPNAEKELLR